MLCTTLMASYMIPGSVSSSETMVLTPKVVLPHFHHHVQDCSLPSLRLEHLVWSHCASEFFIIFTYICYCFSFLISEKFFQGPSFDPQFPLSSIFKYYFWSCPFPSASKFCFPIYFVVFLFSVPALIYAPHPVLETQRHPLDCSLFQRLSSVSTSRNVELPNPWGSSPSKYGWKKFPNFIFYCSSDHIF